MSEAASQSVKGTRATAVTRSSHHGSTPSLAEPSPRARPSGERMRRLSMTLPGQIQAHEPGGRGEHSARRHHRPPGRIDRAKLKAAACIPEQMADATAEMQEVTKYATGKDDLTEPRPHEAVHERVRLRPRSRRHQPRDQCDGANPNVTPVSL
jgi:hypothetical protein